MDYSADALTDAAQGIAGLLIEGHAMPQRSDVGAGSICLPLKTRWRHAQHHQLSNSMVVERLTSIVHDAV